jgi:transposase
LTSKLHLAVDAFGQPVAVILTAGQAGDNPQLLPLLDAVAVSVKDAAGRRVPVRRVLADKAYSHPSSRRELRARGIKATIPERRDQQERRKARGSRGGRPPAFDADWYRARNVVERCFNRLKQFRAIATRFDKTAISYRGMIDLATLLIWL